MPNWCENELRVEGNKKDLQKFKKFAKSEGSVLNHNNFIPYPKKFKELDKKAEVWLKKADELAKKHKAKNWYSLPIELREKFEKENGKEPKDGFNQGGYEWCNDKWGTKWGICEPVLDEFETELLYRFDTAWSPPTPIIIKMSEMFPKLEFELRYFEGGMGFNGLFICKGGEIKRNSCSDYFGDRGG